MAISNNAGMTIGVKLGAPTIAANADDATRTAAYDGYGPYQGQGSCIITSLPVVNLVTWNRSTDPSTICNLPNEIQRQSKNQRTANDATLAGMFDVADAMLTLIRGFADEQDQLFTYELVWPNGTDKLWAEVQAFSFDLDPSNADGRTLFTSGWFYEKKPHTNF